MKIAAALWRIGNNSVLSGDTTDSCRFGLSKSSGFFTSFFAYRQILSALEMFSGRRKKSFRQVEEEKKVFISTLVLSCLNFILSSAFVEWKFGMFLQSFAFI